MPALAPVLRLFDDLGCSTEAGVLVAKGGVTTEVEEEADAEGLLVVDAELPMAEELAFVVLVLLVVLEVLDPDTNV